MLDEVGVVEEDLAVGERVEVEDAVGHGVGEDGDDTGEFVVEELSDLLEAAIAHHIVFIGLELALRLLNDIQHLLHPKLIDPILTKIRHITQEPIPPHPHNT